MFIFDPITPLVLYLLALGAVAVTARIPLRAFALAHIPFLAFGLGLTPRSTWRRIPLTRTDWAMAVAVLTTLGVVVWLNSYLGFLEGFHALNT